MDTARRMIAVATDQPKEALKDVIGLSALCLMIFFGLSASVLF